MGGKQCAPLLHRCYGLLRLGGQQQVVNMAARWRGRDLYPSLLAMLLELELACFTMTAEAIDRKAGRLESCRVETA